MFTQISAKQVIKQFKERDVATTAKDYKQLHVMKTFGRACPEDLRSKQKLDALREINLITEKGYGKIKGRSCADGRAQGLYITNEELVAPTVSMEALLPQLMIGPFEENAMELFDVPGAYLNSDMPEDKFVFFKLEDEFMGIMCEVNPEFRKDFQQEGNKNVLYLRVSK